MLRAYLTVFKDCFHEAFASRVLWILLALSTLFLLALAPLGLEEGRATRLSWDSIRDWPSLIARIKHDSEAAVPSPGKRIWELSDDDFRQTLTDAAGKSNASEISREMVSKLMGGLNRLLPKREFYDEAAWKGIALDQETLGLLKKGTKGLSDTDLAFTNRQLFKAAFPAEVANTPDKELRVTYLVWTPVDGIPATRSMANPVINQVLAAMMDVFVGGMAVFAAILVTASIIPQTFEAGAIDLLLSKPVARPLLFLVKFFGGCAFILLNAGYFVVGLWLIMGLRFGLWNNALLLCIPLFLFLFVVYYSVSAFAGVLWKNAIVSVVVTILFWAACFSVGTAKVVIEQLFVAPTRIVSIVPTADGLLGLNQSGEFVQWQSGAWESVMKSNRGGGPPGAGPSVIGPVYDPAQKRLLYLEPPSHHRFNILGPGPQLQMVTWSGGAWKRETGPAPPTGTSWLFRRPDGEILVVATSGVYRLDETGEHRPAKLLGITIPLGGTGPYVAQGPKPPLRLADAFAAAMDPASGDVAVYSAGTLTYLKREPDGTYSRGPQRDLGTGEQGAALALSGTSIVLALSDGRILLLDAGDLKTRKELLPAGKTEPYVAKASPDGRWFAVLFHNGKLFLVDADGNSRRVPGGAISAVEFENNESLLVADRATRVTKYELGSLHASQRYEPALGTLEASYRYFILPFYTIFPKPGELDNVIAYVLTDQDTQPTDPSMKGDMRQTRVQLDIYGPIWSSLAFVVVMLGITCIYISRADI
jgi:ABC-type transport system involved in multi-copper enzyme maturation permease subunit